VEELFAQRYSTKLRLSTALVTNSALVMSTPTMLVRVLLNLKSIYTGLQQADKVLQITDYLRCDCCCCGIQDVQCSLWAACLSHIDFFGFQGRISYGLWLHCQVVSPCPWLCLCLFFPSHDSKSHDALPMRCCIVHPCDCTCWSRSLLKLTYTNFNCNMIAGPRETLLMM